MKRFLVNILLFFVLIFIVDYAFGLGCDYLVEHAKGGDTKCHNYIARHCNEDVLVFGSSRAIHHYIPSILSDSLGMTVYNCGTDGNGIVFLYSRLLMVTQRYTPKLIIYELTSQFDFAKGDNAKYLTWQKRYYSISGVKEVIEEVSAVEKYKMKSNLYKYNSAFIQILMDNIHPMQNVIAGGYKPLYGTMTYAPPVAHKENVETWDSLKKKLMLKFVNLCKEKNISLVYVYSPHYGKDDDASLDMAKCFAKENHIPLLYHYNDTIFCDKKEYFEDSAHMNDNGARKYSSLIAHELQRFIGAK